MWCLLGEFSKGKRMLYTHQTYTLTGIGINFQEEESSQLYMAFHVSKRLNSDEVNNLKILPREDDML